eukprot:TRINITY_DN12885_c0_g1_i1.p1 TRINITY_DN12885_c0_g1~~TRINITY_DN12885_c0_g1_i1.p1  ORF type:complete len:1146 (+),score=361.06 TRINITY_DN12885_c0_g1_i1:129-3566(+)
MLKLFSRRILASRVPHVLISRQYGSIPTQNQSVQPIYNPSGPSPKIPRELFLGTSSSETDPEFTSYAETKIHQESKGSIDTENEDMTFSDSDLPKYFIEVFSQETVESGEYRDIFAELEAAEREDRLVTLSERQKKLMQYVFERDSIFSSQKEAMKTLQDLQKIGKTAEMKSMQGFVSRWFPQVRDSIAEYIHIFNEAMTSGTSFPIPSPKLNIDASLRVNQKEIAKSSRRKQATSIKDQADIESSEMPNHVDGAHSDKNADLAFLIEYGRTNPGLAHFFATISSEKISVIALHELISCCLSNIGYTSDHQAYNSKKSYTNITRAISNAIIMQYNYDRLLPIMEAMPSDHEVQKKAKSNPNPDENKSEKALKSGKGALRRILKRPAMSTLSAAAKSHFCDNLPTQVLMRIGSLVLNLIIENTSVQPEEGESQPAFYFKRGYKGPTDKNQASYLVCNQLVSDNIYQEPENGIARSFPATPPMIVTPRNWTGFSNGGNLAIRNKIIRTNTNKMHYNAFQRSPGAATVTQILNLLGRTPWRINTKVLNVMEEAWQNGGGIAALPSRTNIPEPEYPKEADNNPELKYAWRRNVATIKRANQDLHGLRCSLGYQLDVARNFKKFDSLFFPHNLDFRGRVYPVHPYLNHMGSDIARGLLSFAEGKKLGKTGLDSLKIHLSNLMGNNKASFEQRLAYTNSNIDKVFESADHPLLGSRWWLESEDPWQALATCIEITAASRSSNPEEFVSHQPIHTDGTCNGLQHYAALGGDVEGGGLVNIIPSKLPADVYTGVSERVAKRVAEDAQQGNPVAIMLNGKIERKIVKQTVMTSVYGVTPIGAREQIKNALRDKQTIKYENLSEELKAELRNHLAEIIAKARSKRANPVPETEIPSAANEIEEELAEDFIREIEEDEQQSQSAADPAADPVAVPAAAPASTVDAAAADSNLYLIQKDMNSFHFLASAYLSKITLGTIQEMFYGARELMDWLRTCATIISHANLTVEWTTPLGLRCMQPYRSNKRFEIRTVTHRSVLTQNDESLPINKSTQRSAFPPNYVHSLDSTHMMLTCLKASKEGLTFAAVHDSYWTHASDIDEMDSLLRDALVDLHKMPLTSDLLHDLKEAFPQVAHLFPAVPKKGALRVEVVKESLYFFH